MKNLTKIGSLIYTKLIYIVATAAVTIIISTSAHIGGKIKAYFTLTGVVEATNAQLGSLEQTFKQSDKLARARDSLIFLQFININRDLRKIKTSQAKTERKMEILPEELGGQIDRRFDDIDRAFEGLEVKKNDTIVW